eukprot:gene31258-37770_t
MALPVKTHDMRNHHFDSTKWNNLKIRDGDIIVTTAYKSGTTWTQHIIMHLLYQGKSLPSTEESYGMFPWVDLRTPLPEVQIPALEAITERRSLKTHLRLDALTYSPKAKYVYVGRDGRDCYMSLVNHYRSGNDAWYAMMNGAGLVGPELPRFDENQHSEAKLFDQWISRGQEALAGETDGWPFWSFFDHVATWWEYRHLPNVKFIHYSDMLENPMASIQEIADFLEIPVQDGKLEEIAAATSFESMRKTLYCVPGAAFKEGAKSFVNKGVNGRWHGVLSEEQLRMYDEKVREKLTPECAAWLQFGKKALK